MDILDALRWRYAVRHFTDDPLPRETVRTLLEAANLTATATGLQPVRLVHVSDPALRDAVAQEGQAKMRDSSDLFVICAQTGLGEADAEAYVQRVVHARGVSRESLDGLYAMVAGGIARRSPEERVRWAQRQAYIVLGNLLATCAVLGVDACPMEGFSVDGVDQALGLPERGLTATVMLAVGRRHPDDAIAGAAKVRMDLEDFVVTL